MVSKNKTSSAVAILHRRYVKDDPTRKSALDAERLNAEVASLIYHLRKRAGVSQSRLATMIGSTQSVISRLEDADYDGHSLSMLSRIASALDQKLRVVTTASDPNVEDLRRAFRRFIRMARIANGWTTAELARRAHIDPTEATNLEEDVAYRPTADVVQKLSDVFGVPQERLAVLAGLVLDIPPSFQRQVSLFANTSVPPATLTKEEKKQFVSFLDALKANN